ncbi:MAG: polyprenyl synthetase family protein [Rickettsiales bacterium]|nr:polyprenyl synthetase family protein [Rickettsiales bacterium]
MKILQKPLKAHDYEKKAKKLKNDLKQELSLIDKSLKSHLNADSNLTKNIVDHILKSGGKRIRPLLTLISAKSLNYDKPEALYLACAVEFIHTATLLHDDVIDHSQTRRGSKTVNNIWDNKSAILVGDFIFAKSFELMVKTNNLVVLKNLSKASSVISEGEIAQLELLNNQKVDFEKYLDIIGDKTARLFAESCRNSAVIANSSSEVESAMYNFGYNLGILFQLIDDILDYFGDTSKLGKTIGDDYYENKVTLPIFLLMQELDNSSFSIQKNFLLSKKSKQDLDSILELLNSNDIKTKSYDFALNYYNKALKAYDKLPSNKYSNILKEILELSVFRIN